MDPFEAYRQAQGAVVELRSREHELEQDARLDRFEKRMDAIESAVWKVVLILFAVVIIAQWIKWDQGFGCKFSEITSILNNQVICPRN